MLRIKGILGNITEMELENERGCITKMLQTGSDIFQ